MERDELQESLESLFNENREKEELIDQEIKTSRGMI
jgi:hypothetical protein